MFPNLVNNVRNAFEQNRRGSQSRRRNRSQPVPPSRAAPGSASGSATQEPPPPQPPPPSNERAPPASMRAIRKIPTIQVAPEDLVDPNNRECCICLEENKLDDRVMRLPCAHIFHCSCITDWLSNHACTCPVCRYEFPTDYPLYEAGRLQRMAMRKPRYAMHELKRMAIPTLLALYRRPVSGAVEKKDLIQSLIDEERIDIIPTPEPVEYKIEELQSMKISQLKRTMEDAGVFFRREDVVEKIDMIYIFENSGRLILIQPEDTIMPSHESISSTTDTNKTTTNSASSLLSLSNEDMLSSPSESSFTKDVKRRHDINTIGHTIIVETVVEDSFVMEGDKKTTIDDCGSPIVMFPEQETQDGVESMDIEEQTLLNNVQLFDQGTDLRKSFQHYTINHLQTLAQDLQIDLSFCLEREEMVDTFVNAGFTGSPDPCALSPLMFSSWSISQLRAVASEANIDLSQCTTGDEIIEKIVYAGNVERLYLRDYLRSLAPLTTKSILDLRAISRELQINISDCLEKDEIIQRLIMRGCRLEVN
mmetsp:Transcript_51087/g.55332  ORF Transcript_51087/g.55332 Transcript_51087/m.55332 type:complete len:534 (-) Transcript_51087:363-1964(-)